MHTWCSLQVLLTACAGKERQSHTNTQGDLACTCCAISAMLRHDSHWHRIARRSGVSAPARRPVHQ